MRRIPMPACVALVACVNAVCWSIVTPPFEVTDEPAHFDYVKQLAETGHLPLGFAGSMPEEQVIALTDLRFYQLREEPASLAVASPAEQRRLEADTARAARLPRRGSPSAGVAASQPPLYYALEAIPYTLGYHSTILVRLQLMRLLSALMAGLTALFVYLFVREALPAEPWAWSAAGLGVAVTPLLGALSGAVNPESMLYAVCAALFYLLARAFRRGLSTGLAAGIGATVAVGLLTKVNFIGLLPGCAVGLAVLTARRARASRRDAWRGLALCCLIAASPLVAAVVVGVASPHTAVHAVTSNLTAFIHHGSILARLQYMWQLYLPRLPGMADDFPGLLTTRQIWFDGFVGLYGWSNVTFPTWVYGLALIPAMAIAFLCVRAIASRRVALRVRAGELLTYALMALGVMAMIAVVSYARFPQVDATFGRTRYLFPMLALLGAMLALAARGAGRRWGPAVGVMIVVAMLAHDIFSQLLVISRYYG